MVLSKKEVLNSKQTSDEVVVERDKNYFKRVNKEALKLIEEGKFDDRSIDEIKNRNKEDFFELVKDFFKNPIEGLKWFGTKIFGETFAKWSNELRESYKNVKTAKDKVVETAKSAYEKTKETFEKIPNELHKVPVVAGMVGAGGKIVEYLATHPEESRNMPKNKSDQLVWWQKIFKVAGVDEKYMKDKTFMDLVTGDKTWEDIKDHVSGENAYNKLKSDVESGQFDKSQLFKGEKIGNAAEKIHTDLVKLSNDLRRLAQNNKSIASLFSVYLGFNILRSKGNVFKTTAQAAKFLLKIATSPLVFAKNNKVKVFCLIMGAYLAKDNTKWDEYTALKLKETRLPKDFEDFSRVIKGSPIYNEVKDDLGGSMNDLSSVFGEKIDGNFMQSAMESLSKGLDKNELARSTFDYLAKGAKESLNMANKSGLAELKSIADNKDLSWWNKLGGYDSKESQDMILEIDKIVEKGFNNKDKFYSLDLEGIKKIQDKYGKKGEFEFSVIGQQVYFKTFEKGELNFRVSLGVDPKLSPNDQLRAGQNYTTGWLMSFKSLQEIGQDVAGGEGLVRRYRSMFKDVLDGYDKLKTVDEVNQSLVNKVAEGSTTVIIEGARIIYKNGKDHVVLSGEVGKSLIDALYKDKNNKDIHFTNAAIKYGQTVATALVFHGVKEGGNKALDGAYKFLTGEQRRLISSKGGWKMSTAKVIFKSATWPISVGRNTWRFAKNVMNDGLGDAFGLREMRLTAGNMIEGNKIGYMLKKKLPFYNIPKLQTTEALRNKLSQLRNTELNLLREKRLMTAELIDGLKFDELKKMFEATSNGKAEWERIMGTNNSLSRDNIKALIESLQAERKRLELTQPKGIREGLSKLKAGIDKKIVETFYTPKAKSTGSETGRLAQMMKRGPKIGPDGVIDITPKPKVGLLGRFNDLPRKFPKLGKAGKAGVVGAVTVALYLGYEALNAKEAKAMGRKEAMKFVPSKTKEINDLAQMMFMAETDYAEKIANPEILKNFVNEENHAKKKETMNGIKKLYLDNYNEIVNFIFVNKDKFEGNIEEIARVLKSLNKAGNFKVETELLSGKKYISFMNGTLVIKQDKNGKLEVGRHLVDKLEETLTSQGYMYANGFGKEIGGGLVPIYGTYRDFERSYKNYKQGATEAATQDFFMGVSSAASDIALPLKAVKGVKAMKAASAAKDTTKNMAVLSTGVIAGMGASMFIDNNEKVTKIE